MTETQNEQRRWELVCGAEWITVFLSGNRKVYVRNHKLDHIFRTMGFAHYMSLCSIASYNENEVPDNFSEAELRQLKNDMILNKAVFIKEFVKCDDVRYDEKENEFLVILGESYVVLNADDMSEIFNSFKEIYCIVTNQKQPFADAKPRNAADEEFLAIIRKAQNNINRKKNGIHTIDSVIMGVTSKTGSNYNLANVWDLTVWQLMEVNSIMHKDDSAYFTKIGIYTGNIDAKKAKIESKDLDWTVREN